MVMIIFLDRLQCFITWIELVVLSREAILFNAEGVYVFDTFFSGELKINCQEEAASGIDARELKES